MKLILKYEHFNKIKIIFNSCYIRDKIITIIMRNGLSEGDFDSYIPILTYLIETTINFQMSNQVYMKEQMSQRKNLELTQLCLKTLKALLMIILIPFNSLLIQFCYLLRRVLLSLMNQKIRETKCLNM